MQAPKRPRLTFDQQVLVSALAAGLPGGSIALLLIWIGDYSDKLRWTVTLFVVLFWLGLAFSLQAAGGLPALHGGQSA